MSKKFGGVMTIGDTEIARLKDLSEYKKEFNDIAKKLSKMLTGMMDAETKGKLEEKDVKKNLEKSDELITRLAEIQVLMNVCKYKKNL